MQEAYGELADLDVALELVPLQRDSARRLRSTLLALCVGAVLFLAVAAANVATLLIGRVQQRRRELAVSLALGAPVPRLMVRLGLELAAVTAAGSALGIAAGVVLARVFWRLRPDGLSGVETVAVSGRVVAILALTVLALLVPGTWTLWRYVGRWRGPSALHRGPAPSGAVRQLLIGAQIALSVIFVAGAWLLGRSVTEQRTEGIGVETEDIVTFQVAISEKVYPTAADRWQVAREVRERLTRIGGVRSVGGVSHLPLGRWPNWSENVATEGMAVAEEAHADHRAITPGYFETLGVRLLEGRAFTDADVEARPLVAILDRPLAKRLFEGSPLGRKVRVGRYGDEGFTSAWATVVGVIEEIRDRGPTVPSSGQVYLPFAQSPRWEISYAVQTTAAADRLMAPVSEVLASVGELAPARMETLEGAYSRAVAPTRFTARLANLSSAISIGLVAIGLFGWVAASCAERRNELGIRMALGAQPARVFGASMMPLIRMLGPGLIGGAILAWLLAGNLESLLFRVAAEAVAACTGAALALGLIGLLAAAWPAWRASVTSPSEALRENR
jgi:putative ABC transport system permease protein